MRNRPKIELPTRARPGHMARRRAEGQRIAARGMRPKSAQW